MSVLQIVFLAEIEWYQAINNRLKADGYAILRRQLGESSRAPGQADSGSEGFNSIASASVATGYGPVAARLLLFIIRWVRLGTAAPAAWRGVPKELQQSIQPLIDHAQHATRRLLDADTRPLTRRNLWGELSEEEKQELQSLLGPVHQAFWQRLYEQLDTSIYTVEALYIAARMYQGQVFSSAAEVDRLCTELIWCARCWGFSHYAMRTAQESAARQHGAVQDGIGPALERKREELKILNDEVGVRVAHQ